MSESIVFKTNRTAVLTLCAVIFAERLGFGRDEALSIVNHWGFASLGLC
jgi:hypothetical protein